MRSPKTRSPLRLLGLLFVLGALAGTAVGVSAANDGGFDVVSVNTGAAESIPPALKPIPPLRIDAPRGRSGKLRIYSALPGEDLGWANRPEGLTWEPLDAEAEGTEAVTMTDALVAPELPGAYRLTDRYGKELDAPVLLVLVPFDDKENGRLDDYKLGTWPGEQGGGRYELPAGFVRVTEKLANLEVSSRLRIKQFLTKNQHNVWPKYTALDMKLLDKLELMADELRKDGKPGKRLYVMSGFRTPLYNAPGVGAGGRATNSRHLWGDAADVWIDDDANGYMDDLNGDGRKNTADARFLLAVQERVEQRYPDLVGGGGVYGDNGAHGPFLHVDCRGYKARWGSL